MLNHVDGFLVGFFFTKVQCFQEIAKLKMLIDFYLLQFSENWKRTA